MSTPETVTVSARDLREVLQALVGEPHEIRELQFTRNGPWHNPINNLVAQLNEQVLADGLRRQAEAAEIFDRVGSSAEALVREIEGQQDQEPKS